MWILSPGIFARRRLRDFSAFLLYPHVGRMHVDHPEAAPAQLSESGPQVRRRRCAGLRGGLHRLQPAAHHRAGFGRRARRPDLRQGHLHGAGHSGELAGQPLLDFQQEPAEPHRSRGAGVSRGEPRWHGHRHRLPVVQPLCARLHECSRRQYLGQRRGPAARRGVPLHAVPLLGVRTEPERCARRGRGIRWHRCSCCHRCGDHSYRCYSASGDPRTLTRGRGPTAPAGANP